MAKVIKKTLFEGRETYYVRDLYLPDPFRIINRELNHPNNWTLESRGITQDEKKLFKIRKGEGAEYLQMMEDSLKDGEMVLKALVDIIGYTHVKNPEDYNNKKSKKNKRMPTGYWGYGSPTPKKTKPKETITLTNNKYDSFVNSPNLEAKSPDDLKEGEILAQGETIRIHRKISTIINPIINELKLLNSRHLYQMLFQGVDDGGTIRPDVIDWIDNQMKGTMSKDYLNDDEKQKEIDNLKQSPLIKSKFFSGMEKIQIPWRPYNRYVNRHNDRELENCVIPGVAPFNIEFPEPPFIFIVNQTDIDSMYDEQLETKIWFIFGKIGEKEYKANVIKSPAKSHWTKHMFNQRKMFNQYKGKLFSNDIYVGVNIDIFSRDMYYHNQQSSGAFYYNHFGPIENTIHPHTMRNFIQEYRDENEDDDAEFPVRNLHFSYKIIELKDIAPKIVNWPRSKPIKKD
tara:strand:- start:1249 stop:2616 length:1368 start_codon:yes stop_codon:yes gene_type:complete